MLTTLWMVTAALSLAPIDKAAPVPALLLLHNAADACDWQRVQGSKRTPLGHTPGPCPSPVQIEWDATHGAFNFPDARTGQQQTLKDKLVTAANDPRGTYASVLSLDACERTAPGHAKPADEMTPFDIMGKAMGGELPCAGGCNDGKVHPGVAFLQGPRSKLMIFQYGTPGGIMSALPALSIEREPLQDERDVRPLPFSREAFGAEALYQCRGPYVHATWHSMQTQRVGSQLVDAVSGESVVGPLEAVAVLWPE